MDMTLEQLISSLEETAGLKKQAAEGEKGDPEKDEKKDEKDAKKEIGKSKDDLEKAEKDVENAEGKNDKEQEQCKEARLNGAALAQEVMSKVAALKLNTTKETEMNKEAAAAGQVLAEALLEKLALAGDINTENGVMPGTVPNLNILNNAQMVGEQSAAIKPMPTGNGILNQGTINEILDGIVADAISQGATSHDQGVGAKARDAVAAEGVVEDSAVPNQVEDEDEREKAAAVSSLVADGYDFASAVEMVKAASEEIEYEETTQIKQAAIGALLDRGVDFDKAVAMVKQAGGMMDAAKGVAKGFAADVKHGAGIAGTQAKALMGARGSAIPGAAKDLAKNRAVQVGAAGAVGAGAAMAAKRSQEKQAAVNALTQSGVDFDHAVNLVNAKASQIYGA